MKMNHPDQDVHWGWCRGYDTPICTFTTEMTLHGTMRFLPTLTAQLLRCTTSLTRQRLKQGECISSFAWMGQRRWMANLGKDLAVPISTFSRGAETTKDMEKSRGKFLMLSTNAGWR